MLLGSMLAGYAFNFALLGIVHAIGLLLSAHCGLPHVVANNTLKAGTVYINIFNMLDSAAPFGGTKNSGFGRKFR